jgi:hypothetical protein
LTSAREFLSYLVPEQLYCAPLPAAVAELADAQASGACSLRGVKVRFLSAAVTK